MADTRSGAPQELTIGSVLLNSGDGLEGFTLTFDTDQFTVTSAGLSSVQNAGGVSASGSFMCLETERTAPVLLGANGARVNLTWKRSNSATAQLSSECILTVSRVLEDRGPRKFRVDFVVDGAPT